MDPISAMLLSSAASAGSTALGNFFQGQNQAAAAQNAAWGNLYMQEQAQGYNAQQASAARDFANQQGGIARDFSAQQQLQAEGFNAQQAQLGRDFTQQMSNTAYQRATADMKAAGLNPILAYQQGGASTPGASMASVGATGAPGVPTSQASSGAGSVPQAMTTNAMQNVVSSALDAFMAKPKVDNLSASTDLTEEQTATQKEQSINAAKQGINLTKQGANIDANTDLVKAQTANEPYKYGNVSLPGGTSFNVGYAGDKVISASNALNKLVRGISGLFGGANVPTNAKNVGSGDVSPSVDDMVAAPGGTP